jgi:hypothetical protein
MKRPHQRHFPYQHPTFGTEKKPKPKSYWEDTVYFLWWSYLKRSDLYIKTCESGGTEGLIDLYKDFGDVRGDSFKEWWSKDSRGMRLFAEPQATSTVQVVTVEEIDKVPAGSILVSVPLNLPKKHLLEKFQKLLMVHHTGKRGRLYSRESSKRDDIKYKFKGQPNIQGLKTALLVYDHMKANPELKLYEVGKILPQFQMELTTLEKQGKKIDYDFKRTVEATVSRYKRKATQSVKNVELGVFP